MKFFTTLTPYRKTVVASLGAVGVVVWSILHGETVDATTIGNAVIGVLTALGVYKATNVSGSQVEPSTHTVTVLTPVGTKRTITTRAPKKTASTVKSSKKKTAPKVGE